MAEIQGLNKLAAELRKRAAAAKKDSEASVAVGYTAAYALYVHENRGMKLKGQDRPSGLGKYWGPRGRAGFLLDVMREMQKELSGIVVEALSKGKTMAQSLLLAGLRLQRESQKNVPVEYGNLRASAFTKLE